MNQMESSRADFRGILELSLARFDDRMDAKFAKFRQEINADLARLEIKIEQRFADLMKWSLVYWLGAVVAIAGLARILR